MTTDNYLEREQTLEVDGTYQLPSLERAAAKFHATLGETRRVRLLATYFDTDDLRLLAAGLTLRRRTGGHDEGWHLKVPTGVPGERTERRLPLGPRVDDPPSELAALVTGHVGTARLAPIVVIDTQRETTPIILGGAETVEIDDDRVVAERLSDGRVSTWREVEVERSGARADVANAIVALLRGGGARPAAITSKVARAMAGRAGTIPADGDALTCGLRAVLDDLGAADTAMRIGEPDALHDLRVATRRFRSALRTFGSLLEVAAADHLRAELKWLGDVFGAARDPEVLAGRLARRVDELDPGEVLGPVRADLVGSQRAAAAAGRAEVLTTIDSRRYRLVIDDLHAFVASVPYRRNRPATTERLRRSVRHEVRRVRRRVVRAQTLPVGQRDAAIHDVRKACKRVRYGAEILRPTDRRSAHRLARRYKELQDVLGDRNDAVMSARWLATEGARVGVRPGHNGYTYGVLAERERRSVTTADERWPGVWRRADKRSVRHFLSRA